MFANGKSRPLTTTPCRKNYRRSARQTYLGAAAIHGAQILGVELVPVLVLPVHDAMGSAAAALDVEVDVGLGVRAPAIEALVAWHLCDEVVQTVGLHLHPVCMGTGEYRRKSSGVLQLLSEESEQLFHQHLINTKEPLIVIAAGHVFRLLCT